MEDLDDYLFDYVLGLLTPEDACKLAVLSTALKGSVERSLHWKTWCEQDSPSLTTATAKDLAITHYGERQSRNYKHLFQRLATKRCAKVEPSRECQIEGEGLSDFVMLVDVYLNDEGVLFCSVESSQLGQELRGCTNPTCRNCEQDCQQDCEASLKGAHKVLSEGKLSSIIGQKMVKCERPFPGKKAPATINAQLMLGKPEVITLSWKLMRKSNGKVQILLNRAVPKDVGNQNVDSNRSKFYLKAARKIKGVASKHAAPTEATMQLVCYVAQDWYLIYRLTESRVWADRVLNDFSVLVSLSKPRCSEQCFVE